MVTKAQLKEYFETGKIPTQAQFGELIDYIAPIIDDNNNNNKTIIFGDNTKPFIDGFRIIHTTVDNTRYAYYLFTMTSKNVSANSVIPYFIIQSSVANNGNDEIATGIHILSNSEFGTYVSKGAGALTATDDIILAIIKNYSYVPLKEPKVLEPYIVSINNERYYVINRVYQNELIRCTTIQLLHSSESSLYYVKAWDILTQGDWVKLKNAIENNTISSNTTPLTNFINLRCKKA